MDVAPGYSPDLSSGVAGRSLLGVCSFVNSGFSSTTRTNLSPFTKYFRGEEHTNESIDYFLSSRPIGTIFQLNIRLLTQ